MQTNCSPNQTQMGLPYHKMGILGLDTSRSIESSDNLKQQCSQTRDTCKDGIMSQRGCFSVYPVEESAPSHYRHQIQKDGFAKLPT